LQGLKRMLKPWDGPPHGAISAKAAATMLSKSHIRFEALCGSSLEAMELGSREADEETA
jgi:hypothetical protein